MISAQEKIQFGSFVTLRYRMQVKLPDGRFEKRQKEGVFNFIYGIEKQVTTLERTILGAKKGERFTIYIPPKELYGERDKNLIKEIPKKGLIRQRIKKGKYYRQIKKGSLISFKILEIKDKTILADFNQPLAGISATLDLEIMDVRKATEKEIISAKETEAKRKIGCA